jgi:hypothetical protein
LVPKAQGTESCNGWSFWHIKMENKLYPLDHLEKRSEKITRTSRIIIKNPTKHKIFLPEKISLLS